MSIEGVQQHLTVNSFNTHVPKIQGGREAPSYNFFGKRLFSINMQIKSHYVSKGVLLGGFTSARN